MLAMRTTLPDLTRLDQDGLKAMILAQHEQLASQHEQLQIKDEQLLWREQEIAHLKLLLAKLRRMQFGRKSEKVAHQIEQLELKLEELEENRSAATPQTEPAASPSPVFPPVTRSSRRALPAHLPRQIKIHEPEATSCPECGGRLQKLGEDSSEMLEWVPGSFQVLRHVRPKLCCTGCA
jgi:transposase